MTLSMWKTYTSWLTGAIFSNKNTNYMFQNEPTIQWMVWLRTCQLLWGYLQTITPKDPRDARLSLVTILWLAMKIDDDRYIYYPRQFHVLNSFIFTDKDMMKKELDILRTFDYKLPIKFDASYHLHQLNLPSETIDACLAILKEELGNGNVDFLEADAPDQASMAYAKYTTIQQASN